jgi:transglutaminase superfamily protein
MKRLLRFFSLNRRDKLLLVQALFWVSVIRLALWVLPFRMVRAAVHRVTRTRVTPRATNQTVATRVAGAVRRVSRRVPGATCLTQALATYLILGRSGHPVSLYVGVTRKLGGSFEAHAWTELEGRILIGDLENLMNYSPMQLMKEEIP